MAPTASVEPYDALLLVSFGGPEQPDDVIPFLENVTRGRDISLERLEEVGQHYFEFGGRSPINDQCRELIEAVRADLRSDNLDLPIYWGNRNWDPFLTDTMAKMSADGVRRAAAFVTSAYSSYSGCRQYREDLFRAVDATDGAPRIDKLRHYFNHPGFVTAFVESTVVALEQLPADHRADAPLIFVTHSIPETMAASAGPDGGAYVQQHRSVATLVVAGVAARTGEDHPWELAYCSRSGSPKTPWLEPDVNDHLQSLSDTRVRAVVTVPIGFVSDHMEVIYDLDTEAASTAARLGLGFVRAATPGISPPFVSMVRELLVERAEQERGEETVPAALGDLGPSWNECEVHCCANPRRPQPALCQRAASPVSP